MPEFQPSLLALFKQGKCGETLSEAKKGKKVEEKSVGCFLNEAKKAESRPFKGKKTAEATEIIFSRGKFRGCRRLLLFPPPILPPVSPKFGFEFIPPPPPASQGAKFLSVRGCGVGGNGG